eukprot:1136301-Pelagomonas_calceolata.AAC.8
MNLFVSQRNSMTHVPASEQRISNLRMGSWEVRTESPWCMVPFPSSDANIGMQKQSTVMVTMGGDLQPGRLADRLVS